MIRTSNNDVCFEKDEDLRPSEAHFMLFVVQIVSLGNPKKRKSLMGRRGKGTHWCPSIPLGLVCCLRVLKDGET